MSEKRVKPLVMKYSEGLVSPSYATMDLGVLVIFLLSSCCYTCEVTVFPDFEPTEYLFERHAGKGEHRW